MMRCYFVLLSLHFTATAAFIHLKSDRAEGAENPSITEYPQVVALLYSADGTVFTQDCGGTIITTTVILTTANCLDGDKPENWQIRAGSSDANDGGTVYTISTFIPNPHFNKITMDSDIALMRTTKSISFGTEVAPASIAGPSYIIPPENIVWAMGWATLEKPASDNNSTVLQVVKLRIVNQLVCANQYETIKKKITDNMLCIGTVGGEKGQCEKDYGSPVYHNDVVVGIYSWSNGCGLPNFASVNTRISKFYDWIQANTVVTTN